MNYLVDSVSPSGSLVKRLLLHLLVAMRLRSKETTSQIVLDRLGFRPKDGSELQVRLAKFFVLLLFLFAD